MSVVSNIEINSIPLTYCYCCNLNNVNTSLDSVLTCPLYGCINTTYSSISLMQYCNDCNILFELNHPHSLMNETHNVKNVKMITDYTYNIQTVAKIPVFDSFSGMETLFINNDIIVNEKKCFCRNIVYCTAADITDDPSILETCQDSIT